MAPVAALAGVVLGSLGLLLLQIFIHEFLEGLLAEELANEPASILLGLGLAGALVARLLRSSCREPARRWAASGLLVGLSVNLLFWGVVWALSAFFPHPI